MNKVNRLWSVKGFNYEEITDPEYTKKYEPVKCWRRKLVVLARSLSYQAAKELCLKYSALKAYIAPDIKDMFSQVTKLN